MISPDFNALLAALFSLCTGLGEVIFTDGVGYPFLFLLDHAIGDVGACQHCL